MFYDDGFATMGIERVARCMTVWAKGEGSELVFKFRIYSHGNQIDGIEVLTQISPVSFTPRYFESRKGGPEDALWTGRHTKAE